MKKTLVIILALILSLSVFAGVTVFADDDPVEWDHYLVFSYSGYEYGKPADEISVGFARADWSWAFDGVYAYLEADGEQVTGLIADGIEYTLVIKMKIIPGIDKYYGFSALTKDTVKLNNKKASSPTAFEYYSEGEYLIAKFALSALAPAYNSVDFSIEGFAIGADAQSIVVTAITEGIIVRRAEVCVKEYPEGPYKPVKGELEAGAEYVLIMDYIAPEGIAIQPFAKVSLYGAGDKPVANNGVTTIDNGLGYGRAYYLSNFALPILEEEIIIDSLEGDMDGDGEITVSDALRALRIAAGLDVATATKGTRSAILGDVDGDGAVTVADALAILRKAAGLA